MDKPKVIMTCFAGRQSCMPILLEYVTRLLNKGLIDEFHAWNFAKKEEDQVWLLNLFANIPNAAFKLMPNSQFRQCVSDRTFWGEYYDHYTRERYGDETIIIKCDDDIVFIDVDTFASFIEYRRAHPEILLLFPGIINNELSNYYQQQVGLLPPNEVGEMIGEIGGCGALWNSGVQTQLLHRYFVTHIDEFLNNSKNMNIESFIIPYYHRISVNFFAIMGRDLKLFQDVGNGDDEHLLTTELPAAWKRYNALFLKHVVVHLSFHKQVETGMDVDLVRSWYQEISTKRAQKYYCMK